MSLTFSRILELAMGASSDSPLTAIIAGPSDKADLLTKETQCLTFPKECFPASCQFRYIPADEMYLDELRKTLTESLPGAVIIVPPFVALRFLPDSLRQQFPGLSYEEIVIQLAADLLPGGSVLGIILPASFFQSQRNRAFRANLFSTCTPKLLITHAHSLAQLGLPVHKAFRMNTLVVEKGSSTRLVRFFKCPDPSDEALGGEMVADLTRLMKQGGGKTRFGYIIREGLPAEAPLVHDLYDPIFINKQKTMTELGQLRRLADIAEIRQGIVPSLYANHLLDGESAEGIPLIDSRNIGSDNQLHLDAVRHRVVNLPPEQLLRLGDLCLPSITRQAGRIHLADITNEVMPLAASSNVIVLRIKPDLKPAERRAIVAYLRSPHAAEQFRALEPSLQGHMRITLANLSEMPVPILDDALRVALNEINDSIGHFQGWIKEAESAQDALFEFARPKEDRLQLLSTGRLTRQRCESAKSVSNLRHRIRTQFPNPIAFRWRTVESSRPDLEGYQNLLECAEVAVCYLACMAFVIERVLPDFKINYFTEIAKRMSASKPHGTNMGDWVSVIREVRGSKAIRNSTQLISFGEIAFIDDETNEALQKLVDSRNDFSHGRGPKGSEIKERFEDGKECLESFLEGIEFVTEYPLRYIERAKRDTLRQRTEYQYRELMGDHPLVPLLTASTDMAEIEEESLYLADRDGKLSLLRPLLSFVECPECHRWSVFYLDKYKKTDGQCVLKSMENGHTIDSSELAPAFRKVGLIP